MLLGSACMLVCTAALSSAQEFTGDVDDPVEGLRLALKEPSDVSGNDPVQAANVKKHRKEILEKRIAALTTLPELRRGLMLPEWREDRIPQPRPKRDPLDPDAPPADVNEILKIDMEQRKLLADRFKKEIGKDAEFGVRDRKLAVALMIAGIPPTFRAPDGDQYTNFTQLLLPEVLKLTNDPDVGVREQALPVLSVIHAAPDKVAARFREALKEDPPKLHLLAARGLLTMMKVVNTLRLPQGDQRVIVAPADVFNTAKEVVTSSLIGLQDGDWRVRAACLEAIHEAAVGLESDVQTFQKKAKDPLPPPNRPLSDKEIENILKEYNEVRDQFKDVATYFKLFRDNVPQITASLGDPDIRVRSSAINALSTIAKVRLLQKNRLMSVPLTRNLEEKMRMEKTLIVLEDPLEEFLQKSLPQLAVQLRSEQNAALRQRFFEFLELLDADAMIALPQLIEGLDDPDSIVRLISARIVKTLVQPPRKMTNDQMRATVPGLAKLLASPDLATRDMAALALEGMGPLAGGAKQQLLITMRHVDAENRRKLFPVITHLSAEDASMFVPELIQSLAHKDARLREDAARTLGRLGKTAEPAVPSLRRLLGDPREEVREAAGDAILNILPAPK
jgi:HEAT repeat protein